MNTHTIIPSKEYSIGEIVKHKLFPWATHIATVRKTVKADMRSKNELSTRIEGSGHTTRYHIKGSNIKKYVAKYGHILVRNK